MRFQQGAAITGQPIPPSHINNLGLDVMDAQNGLFGVRQSVINGAIDRGGLPSMVTAGTGLSLTVLATATNVILSFAAGYSGILPAEYKEVLVADATVSSLAASSTLYVYATRVSAGVVTIAADLLQPIYSESEPLTYTDTAPSGGTASGATNPAGSLVTSAASTGAVLWQRTLATNQTGVIYEFGIHGSVSTGTATVALQASTNGTTWTTLGSNVSLTTTQAFTRQQVTATTYKYLRLLAVTASSQTFTINQIAMTTNLPVGTLANGQFWFDPVTMIGQTWSTTTSTWTAVQRVYLGEVVTGSAAVTSVITYAYQGRYVSPPIVFAPANNSTSATESHNLGLVPYIASATSHNPGQGSAGIGYASTAGFNFDRLTYTVTWNTSIYYGRIILARGW